MVLQFENRYQAINYYKQKAFEIDESLQRFLVLNQRMVDKRIQEDSKKMSEFNDLIEWNKSELRKEVINKSPQTLTSFSRDEP
jgi:hypothetical protein